MSRYEVGFVTKESAESAQEKLGVGEVKHSDDIDGLPEGDTGWSVVGGEDLLEAARDRFVVLDIERQKIIL